MNDRRRNLRHVRFYGGVLNALKQLLVVVLKFFVY